MKQNYFIYNGKQYRDGTIVVLSRFDCISMKTCNSKAEFLYYDTQTKEYNVKIYGKEYAYTKESFYNNLLGIHEQKTTIVKTQNEIKYTYKFSDELKIDALLIAWVWYVFIMVVGVIFYDRIGIWILSSIIFFNYRNKKLKEAGYK